MLRRLVAAALGLCWGGEPVLAQSQDAYAAAGFQLAGFESLNLLVRINGREDGGVCEFQRNLASGALSATVSDLASVGLRMPFAKTATIDLTALPGLDAVYDAPSQSLMITAAAVYLAPREIFARAATPPLPAQAGWGLVLNYQANSRLGEDVLHAGLQPKALYFGLDLRGSTPLGVLKLTGTATTSDRAKAVTWAREDTAFVHVAQASMARLTLGDFVSAGLAGSAALRMGGVQFRRDFSANRNFVTDPRLSYAGLAVLPSALDVYIGSLRAWSGAVDAGPFTLRDIPTLSPEGEAVFVLRDPSGVEKTSRVSFFRTQNLLRRGLVDYAFQAGFARESYAQSTGSYGKALIGLGNLRYGVNDHLTLSGQIEAAKGIAMLGGGIDTALFGKAEFGLYAAQSQSGRRHGRLAAVTLRSKIAGFDLRASTRRRFGDFEDMASFMATAQNPQFGTAPLYSAPRLEQAISLSIPITAGRGGAGLSYLRSQRAGATVSILQATYSRAVQRGALQINGFTELSAPHGFGLSVGMSFPFGKSGFGSAQIAQTPRGGALQLTVARQAGRSLGDTGYRLAVYQQSGALSGTATLTRQSRIARSELTLRSQSQRVSADVQLTGALVLAGGAGFLTRQIQDSYGVVAVGAPGVVVSVNNRPAATTGPRGRAIVPDLRAYQANRISINPLELPLDLTISASAMQVVPMQDAGVVVSFGGRVEASALVVLRDAKGAFLPLGTPVILAATKDSFPVGYDGQVWIEGLKKANKINALSANGPCAARFDFTADPAGQVFIDGVVCQ
jgi:outer membrane usher protein